MLDAEAARKKIKWAARLPHVRDVTLFGTAALDYWKRRLEPARLTPVDDDGRARVMVVAADSRFLGISFREISISIAVNPLESMPGGAAATLIQAYNSVRLFAFCERKLFHTPYLHGQVRVAVDRERSNASVLLERGGTSRFQAQLTTSDDDGLDRDARQADADARHGDASNTRSDTRKPLAEADDGWEGVIYLPARDFTQPGDRHFFACIRGYTRTFAFLPDRDRVELSPQSDDVALRDLADSGFIPERWAIREDAQHAKSKTYRHAARG